MSGTSFDKEELKKKLTPEQYHITQEKGTERPFTSPLLNAKSGEFYCVVCNEHLFTHTDKFESGCGWPSFAAPAKTSAVAEHPDLTLGMVRTEVTCSKCGAHLGHVFDDGGKKSRTGLRYCINGVALKHDDKSK